MIFAFVFMLLMTSAMAIGVIMGRKPISGSCGGMKALGMDVECEICGGNPALCESEDSLQGHPATPIDDGRAADLTKRIGR
jgi:hypothetical protein